MLLREKLVEAELAAAKTGIREVGGNNHGPEVKKFLAEVGLPEGFAWCDAFQSYEEHAAAGRRLPIESASVAQTYAVAKQIGWLVGQLNRSLFPEFQGLHGADDPWSSWQSTPARDDLVLYDFDGDGKTDDHIEIAVSVVALPGCWKLNTVGGNTGDGSAADGDGVYLRTRVVRRSSVAFVRIPGNAPAPLTVAHKPAAKKPAAKKPAPLPTLKSGAKGPNVRKLQQLLRRHGASVVVDGVFGQRTLASVRAFQKRAHLPADGVVGPATWTALNAKGAKS